MNIDMAAVGRRCIRRRQELGYTQSELARIAGVNIKTVCNLEHGKCLPRMDNAIPIAAALRMSVEQLTGFAACPPQPVDLSQLGKRIQQMRKAVGLTTRPFAARADISETALFCIESGESMPRIDTLLRIADAFGISVASLIGEA